MCINTYSPIEGVCVTSNKGHSWQGLGEDVSQVEACRHMMYLDVSFLQMALEPLDFQVDMFGPRVHTQIYKYIQIYKYLYLYLIIICVCVCVCACVCVCVCIYIYILIYVQLRNVCGVCP
jgi:hypothetical protein